MGRASITAIYRQDKPAWRDALTFLRARAWAGDAIASVRPHGPSASMGAYVIGKGRYFGGGGRFLQIECETPVSVLEERPWSDRANTVWILCNRACQGGDLPPTPLRPTQAIRRHDFHGLFVLEIRGEGPAAARLMDGLALLNRDLPEGRGLVASNLFRARYYRAQGDDDRAVSCVAAARRQCRGEPERVALLKHVGRDGALHARATESAD